MLQASILDCVAFDPFSFQQDCLAAAEVHVCRRQIAQALVVAPMIVVIDEPIDAGFKITGQVVVFQQDAVLERLMPSFDLALCLWMLGRAPNVTHFLSLQPICKLTRHVAGTIIAEQARLVNNPSLVAT